LSIKYLITIVSKTSYDKEKKMMLGYYYTAKMCKCVMSCVPNISLTYTNNLSSTQIFFSFSLLPLYFWWKSLYQLLLYFFIPIEGVHVWQYFRYRKSILKGIEVRVTQQWRAVFWFYRLFFKYSYNNIKKPPTKMFE
jgi:hypothetical protein